MEKQSLEAMTMLILTMMLMMTLMMVVVASGCDYGETWPVAHLWELVLPPHQGYVSLNVDCVIVLFTSSCLRLFIIGRT